MQETVSRKMTNPILIKSVPTKKLHSTKLELAGRQCASFVRCGDFDSASTLLSELLSEASIDQVPIIDGMADVCIHVQAVTKRTAGYIEVIARLLADDKRLALSDIRKHRGAERSRLVGIKYVIDHLVSPINLSK